MDTCFYHRNITASGLTFGVSIEHDDAIGPPWEEHDGHGVVSEWTTRPKRPGERILSEDFWTCRRYYDVQASMEIAKRDGWGIAAERRAKLEAAKGGILSPGEIAAAAVAADFDRLRAWCDDRWHWCAVVVTLLDEDGDETWETESLGGIESDGEEYMMEVAGELADAIADRIGAADSITRGAKTVRIR